MTRTPGDAPVQWVCLPRLQTTPHSGLGLDARRDGDKSEEDEAPGWAQLVEDVHHGRQLLPGACHHAVVLVVGVQGEVGDATLDLKEDGVKGQSELETCERVPLVEASAACNDFVAEEQMGGGSVAGGHPRQQLREVLLHL